MLSEHWEPIGAAFGGVVAGVASVLGIKKKQGTMPKAEDKIVLELRKEVASQNDRIIRLETTVENFIDVVKEERQESRARDEKIFDRLDSIGKGLAMVQARRT